MVSLNKYYVIIFLCFGQIFFLHAKESFLPPNNLHLKDSLLDSQLTKEEFVNVIKKVEKFYVPYIDRMGEDLAIYQSWSSNTVNAYADRSGGNFNVTIYGGIARHWAVTLDGLALVLCHEIGHHIGGSPRKLRNKWSSVEGQADYFSTAKCLKNIFAQDDNITLMQNVDIPLIVQTKCQNVYTDQKDKAMCYRISLAGLSISFLLWDLEFEPGPPQFDTPDLSEVEATTLMHPPAQCRLDTFFQGVLCKTNPRHLSDSWDEKKDYCSRASGDVTGSRPLCWYRPQHN